MDSTTHTGIPVSPDTQPIIPCTDSEVLDLACVPTSDTPTQDRLHDIADVIDFCKRHNFPADVVGRWVWIRFDSKPDQETRDLLKASGFRWVQARQQWAHNCGFYTRKGTANPRWKYGEIPVNAITSDDLKSLKGVA